MAERIIAALDVDQARWLIATGRAAGGHRAAEGIAEGREGGR